MRDRRFVSLIQTLSKI